MIEVANVIVRGKKVYLPSTGKTPDGLYVDIEPVHAVDLDHREIVAALEKVVAAGIRQIATPSAVEMRRIAGRLPRAAGVRGWKALAQGGQAYAIIWAADRIELVPSKHDKQGRWVGDYTRARVFPKDTPLSTIVTAILEDARSRAEVGLAGDPGQS